MIQLRGLTLRHFAGDEKGATVIVFALALIPMVLLLGVTIDYSSAERDASALRAASDVAVLSVARELANAGTKSTEHEKPAYARGAELFKSNISNIKEIQEPSIKFSFKKTVDAVLVTANYKGRAVTYFPIAHGLNGIALGGTSQATVAIPSYKNFIFIVDVSASMGLAATQAGIDSMKTLTGCALACHLDDSHRKSSSNGYKIARDNAITLRLDVIKKTMKDIFGSVESNPVSDSHFKFGLYTLENKMTDLSGSDSLVDAAKAATLVDAIDLAMPWNVDDPSTKVPDAWTNYEVVLKSVLAQLPSSGDGSSPASAKNYVFLMTDGVDGVPMDAPIPPFVTANGVCPGPMCNSPIDPSLCQQFKDKKATFGVVYTTYLQPDNNRYNSHVAPFASNIAPRLKECASTNFFREGTDGDSISQSLLSLYAAAMGSPRLSQ